MVITRITAHLFMRRNQKDSIFHLNDDLSKGKRIVHSSLEIKEIVEPCCLMIKFV